MLTHRADGGRLATAGRARSSARRKLSVDIVVDRKMARCTFASRPHSRDQRKRRKQRRQTIRANNTPNAPKAGRFPAHLTALNAMDLVNTKAVVVY
jgi:hypothetical protein